MNLARLLAFCVVLAAQGQAQTTNATCSSLEWVRFYHVHIFGTNDGLCPDRQSINSIKVHVLLQLTCKLNALNVSRINHCGYDLISVVAHGHRVPALPPANIYYGPTLDAVNPCACSSVVYSLMSACGACQGARYLSYVSRSSCRGFLEPDQRWPKWNANCQQVYVGM